MSGRPSLFLSARSWVDSTGSGIPDWWLLQYFGRTDLDPYALCPSGDGWTILQAYQNGWNPTQLLHAAAAARPHREVHRSRHTRYCLVEPFARLGYQLHPRAVCAGLMGRRPNYEPHPGNLC